MKINSISVLAILLIVATASIVSLWKKVHRYEGMSAFPSFLTANKIEAADQKNIVGLGHLPLKGSGEAKMEIVVFEDFRCPFCKKSFNEIEQRIIDDYIDSGKVKLAFRNFQFLGSSSEMAGNAAECANEQHKFWELHDYLFKNQPDESDTSLYTIEKLSEIAGSLSLDPNQFKSCLSARKYQNNVDQDLLDGQKAGVSMTPTLYINGIQLAGDQPYITVKTIIDHELTK